MVSLAGKRHVDGHAFGASSENQRMELELPVATGLGKASAETGLGKAMDK